MANISLNAIFSSTEVSAIIMGMSGTPTGWPGRYGGSPGLTSAQSSIVNQQLELLKLFEFPTGPSAALGNPLTALTSFGTLPDLKDRRILGIDPRGQPINLVPGTSPTGPTYFTSEVKQGAGSSTESPYGFDLARSVPQAARYVSSSTIDDPFTVGELEAVLRQYDVHVRSLPQRLYSILPSLQSNANQRNKITTVSSDLPSPNLPAPRDLRTALASVGLHQAFGITDLLNAKFKQNCPTLVNNAAEIAKLLPPELIAGVRMDINRPFGNGRDDNNNGLVDEPGGISSNKPSAPDSATETVSANGEALNVTNWNMSLNPADPLMSANLPIGVKARQLMARQLYALMMLFADQGFTNWTIEPGIAAGSPLAQQITARRVAQWAINAVSFRDATSIMTPFEYHWDIYQSSYQGWTVNGDPGDVNNQKSTNGNIGLVWACKPPDAVLTETLAFHDKRIADTNWDTGNSKMTTDMPPDAGGATPTPAGKMPPAGNFDQTRIPQGSAFIEVLCTRNPNLPFAPTDLYTKNTLTGQYCLDLGEDVGRRHQSRVADCHQQKPAHSRRERTGRDDASLDQPRHDVVRADDRHNGCHDQPRCGSKLPTNELVQPGAERASRAHRLARDHSTGASHQPDAWLERGTWRADLLQLQQDACSGSSRQLRSCRASRDDVHRLGRHVRHRPAMGQAVATENHAHSRRSDRGRDHESGGRFDAAMAGGAGHA